MSEPRFHLYIKASRDGNGNGDCPFSQRANMYCHLKQLGSNVKIIPVDITAKSEEFTKLTSSGTTPVFVDTHTNEVITDSGRIPKYLDELFPDSCQSKPDESAVNAMGGIFPKFAGYIKNKDQSLDEEKKTALVGELKKLNEFLKPKIFQGPYLSGDHLCDLDCQILPKLRHVQVAGKRYKGFEIPDEFIELKEYIKAGEKHEVFQSTCAPDEEFIHGWKRHLE